jgi:hypothetical protein
MKEHDEYQYVNDVNYQFINESIDAKLTNQPISNFQQDHLIFSNVTTLKGSAIKRNDFFN